jgi:RNA polymerase sigma-70 factor (ECF subfamily)
LEQEIKIADLRAGNQKSFEMLFTKWYAPLCSYAYSILADQDEAQDIAQKVFYKLWDRRAEIEIHTSLKSYLYRMTHNACMNKIKELHNKADHHRNIAYTSSDAVNDTEERISQNELQQHIFEAIENLPPRCREIFKLSRFEQCSYAEIARQLDISSNTVETQMVKALRFLRERLKDYLPLIFLLYLIACN